MSLPLAACAAFLLLAQAERDDPCRPEETVRRRVEARYELALTGARVAVDGEEQPAGATSPYATGGALELVLEEAPERCVDGRPTRFVRRYAALGGERWEGVGDGRRSWSESSALAGAAVRFERAAEAWRAAWAEPEREGEPPRGLVASLALEELGPPRGATVGATWEVPTSAARALLEPWSAIPFHPAGLEPSAPEAAEPDERAPRGTLGARLEAVEGDVALVALELELVEERDLTERVRAASEAVPLPEGARRPRVEAVEDRTTQAGGGHARWDLRRGRLVALELECRTEQVQTVRTRIALGQREATLERVTTLAGSLRVALRVE